MVVAARPIPHTIAAPAVWRRLRHRLQQTGPGKALRALGYRALLFVLALLPYRLSLRAARAVGAIRFHWHRYALDPQATNLRERLGATPAQTERILQGWFQRRTAEDIDNGSLRLRSKEQALKLIEVRGLEHLERALAAGHGAILYSGHVCGNYALLAVLGVLGYKPNFIRLRRPASTVPLVDRAFYRGYNALFDKKFGCRMIWTAPSSPPATAPDGRSADRVGAGRGAKAEAVAALRRNEVVIILIDLSHTSQNLDVSFFGGPARFPRGPHALATATGAVLLDFYVRRSDDLTQQIAEIGLPLVATDNVGALLQACASRLDAHIRHSPADWLPWHIFKPAPNSDVAPEGR